MKTINKAKVTLLILLSSGLSLSMTPSDVVKNSLINTIPAEKTITEQNPIGQGRHKQVLCLRFRCSGKIGSWRCSWVLHKSECRGKKF